MRNVVVLNVSHAKVTEEVIAGGRVSLTLSTVRFVELQWPPTLARQAEMPTVVDVNTLTISMQEMRKSQSYGFIASIITRRGTTLSTP